MISLKGLNDTILASSFEYTDERYARVIFDRETADNKTKTVNEGESFAVSIGIEITDVVNYAVSQPTMTVNLSSVDAEGVSLTWDVGSTGCTVVESTPGVYVCSGINSAAIWDQIKQPTIVQPTNLPHAFHGNWSYTVTIDYYNANTGWESQQFTVAVNTLDVTFMSTPMEFIYVTNTANSVTHYPQIQDYDADYPGATWTIEATVNIESSITSFSSGYTSGGTFTYTASPVGFTIEGTRTEVNGHLANLTFTSNTVENDFNVYYVLTNDQDSTTDTKVQAFKNSSIEFLSNTGTNYFVEDTAGAIIYNPIVTDTTYPGSGTYTVTVAASTFGDVYAITSDGTDGTSEFDDITKTLTITGTKTQVNSHLNSLTMQAEEEVDYLFYLVYTVTTPNSDVASKTQQMICSSSDAEISNLAVTRTYVSNNANNIFATNTPQITDFDTTGTDTYTLFLECTFGDWSADGYTLSNPFSYSGTRAEVNAIMTSIQFLPDPNISSNGTFELTLQKNSNTIAGPATIALTGSVGSYTGRTVTLDTTQTWTPTAADVQYGRYEIAVVGGGGGGGYSLGGGGGGGVVRHHTGLTFVDSTYTATIGVGGTAGVIGTPDGGNGGTTTWKYGTTTLYTAPGGGGGSGNLTGGSSGGNAGGNGIITGGGDAAGGGATTSSLGESAYSSSGNGYAGDGILEVTVLGGLNFYYGCSGGGGTNWTGGGGDGAAFGNGRGGESDREAYAGDRTNPAGSYGHGGGGGGSGTYANGAKGADGGIKIVITAA